MEQPENLELELERIANKHFVEKEEIRKISRKKIKSFIESDLANRMKKASEQNKLWKEQPFVIGIPAKEIKEEWESEEFVLIQGIIDIYFEEEDEEPCCEDCDHYGSHGDAINQPRMWCEEYSEFERKGFV